MDLRYQPKADKITGVATITVAQPSALQHRDPLRRHPPESELSAWRGRFFHTRDGALAVGQPEGAATWYPVNDHPLDQASYTFKITVPRGLQAIANGVLKRTQTAHGRITWTWQAKETMASYLSSVVIGHFDIRTYRKHGISRALEGELGSLCRQAGRSGDHLRQ